MLEPRFRTLATLRATALVWVPLLLVGALHYLTPAHTHWVHDVARRLFYVPIVFGAVLGGVRGGLLTALLTLAVYLPHALFLHVQTDPGSNVEKLLEMGFYLLLGLASGLVSEHMASEARSQAALARDLQHTLSEVEAKDAQLQRAARLQSLGELTAGLAHEIRNPLHGMRGAAEIVLDAVPPEAPERELGLTWIREIDRLSSVLKRFLDFARGSPPEVARVTLSDVVEQVLGLFESQARRQGTEVLCPPRDERAVHAEHDQLVQVVLGLCINALQALEQGGTVTLSLDSATHEGRSFHGIRVANDGHPIPTEDVERIFDPFFSTKEGGTGLGLPTAWRIVDLHGGRLEVEPGDQESGPSFLVLLPACDGTTL